ncbi:MAG: hypothetical protein ACRDY2_08970 [Acidimicrobiales bacterium]
MNIGGGTIGAFIVIAIVVLALAGYLITVAFVLKRVSVTLGSVITGVRAIANQTAPVGEVVGDIAANVLATQNALRGVLGMPSVGRRTRQMAAASGMASGGAGPVSLPPGRNPLRAPGSRRSGGRRGSGGGPAPTPSGGVGAVSMRDR